MDKANEKQVFIPYSIVAVGKSHDYLKLKQQYNRLLKEIDERSLLISELYQRMLKQMDITIDLKMGYFDSNQGVFNTNAAKKTDAWHTAPLMNELSREIVKQQGTLEEVKSQFVEVKDMLKTLCEVNGVREKFEENVK